MKHQARKHSALSPSNSSKWLNCTASTYMEQSLPQEEEMPSVFAEEGTLAHEIAETMLRLCLSDLYADLDMSFYYNHKGLQDSELREQMRKLKTDPLYYPAMLDELQPYINSCLDTVVKGSWVELEPQIDLSVIANGMKGHIDFVNHTKETLHITDLKFGRGIEVEANDNSQLILYAIGFIATKKIRIPKQTFLTIVQPRRHHISTVIISEQDINDFIAKANSVTKLIYAGQVNQTFGKHCNWCKAKLTCATFQDKVNDYLFVDSVGLTSVNPTETQLEQFLSVESVFKRFFVEVREHIKAKLLKGDKMELFKLVEGQSRRKINPNEIPNLISELELYDFTSEQYETRAMKGLTELKKLLKAKLFRSLVEPFTIKTKGDITVAYIHDKRVEVANSAESDFADIDFD